MPPPSTTRDPLNGRGPWAAFIVTSLAAAACNAILGIKEVGPTPGPGNEAGKPGQAAAAGSADAGDGAAGDSKPSGGGAGSDVGSGGARGDAGTAGTCASIDGESPAGAGAGAGGEGGEGGEPVVRGACNPAEERCASNGVERCQKDRTWKRLTVCRTDQTECGSCPIGEPCGDLEKAGCASGFCFDGLCEATSCTHDEECASGYCYLSYRDLDGDGYGTGDVAGRCDHTVPDGYAPLDGDCCDLSGSSAAAMVHPGTLGWYGLPSQCPGVEFDYDCSGVEERSPMPSSCSETCLPVNAVHLANVCGGYSTAVTECVGDSSSCDARVSPVTLQLCH